MRFINENFKFSGMKKEAEFTIYPCKASDTKIILQSDTRIMSVDLSSGLALLSKRCGNGAGFVMLSKALGAYEVELTGPQLILALSMRDRMAGNTNKDGSFNLIGRPVTETIKEDVNSLLEIKEDLKKPKTDIECIREEVAASFTIEELRSFKDFSEFFAAVDTQNAYEEEWAENKDRYKISYRIVWFELVKMHDLGVLK